LEKAKRLGLLTVRIPRPSQVTYALELARVAPTTRHPLYDLYRLAVLVLNDVPDIEEALIAAVGCLIGENFGGLGAYT
jgi:hypothetical protein